jgi:hypothetical protein
MQIQAFVAQTRSNDSRNASPHDPRRGEFGAIRCAPQPGKIAGPKTTARLKPISPALIVANSYFPA